MLLNKKVPTNKKNSPNRLASLFHPFAVFFLHMKDQSQSFVLSKKFRTEWARVRLICEAADRGTSGTYGTSRKDYFFCSNSSQLRPIWIISRSRPFWVLLDSKERRRQANVYTDQSAIEAYKIRNDATKRCNSQERPVPSWAEVVAKWCLDFTES